MKAGINKSRAVPAAFPADAELIEGLRRGDDALLSALYRKYYVMVLKMVVGNSGSEEEARDVYQDTMIVLFENARKRDFVLSCALQTYVYSVARRLWLKQLKRAGRIVLLKEEEEREFAGASVAVDEHLEKEADIERMQNSLLELGEPCATLIADYYVRKMSMEAIAEKFGYTNADNAKNQKYKCLQRLKRRFFRQEEAAR